MCVTLACTRRYHTDTRVVTENIGKAVWQIFLPQNVPAARDIFRYTLHGKFHREIYRMRVAFRAGVSSRVEHREEISTVNIGRGIKCWQYRDKK